MNEALGGDAVPLAGVTALVLTSRLIPGLDGGYTVATLQRARLLADAGARVRLLSVDPGAPTDHAAHREAFVTAGAAESVAAFRNLFDDAAADPAWLIAAATPGAPTPGVEYREIPDAAGRPLLALPVISADPDWHLTQAAVVVHAPGGDRILPGFGGLYRAWLAHVVAGLTQPIVLFCESRQLGELLAEDPPHGVRIVHTIHTTHLSPPYGPDAPVNDLWRRWFAVADRFDAVLWPTEQQRADAEERFGAHPGATVLPNAAPPVVDEPAPVDPHRVVMLGRLAPGKRIDHAIRAWRRVVAAVPEARLEIWGDGALRDDLQRLIDECGLAASVTLEGRSDAGPALFDGAALMVQTTAFEGQGLAALEAMSRGVAVVSYDVRYGPRDQLGTGGGVLVPDGEEDAFADAVVELLQSPDAREEAARVALRRAADFAPARIRDALAALVRRILAPH
ncbi:poly(glycerol-phosphate) alpha-glucosyltransferase [Microbacterium sp. SORGH_AS428]|uniref:glycosyltransferase n=1 Tax=Microbacterium sp. SORGH_AS_0428 TaxID=3041788 RepID=UPI00285E3B8D|nr:glycosyltransferase [Microbacterium sp. SORGH_AS_0428]MDR6199216.1 poly(glycerol-phosphate) alpha-glucosyltransferase [Microbacterium sp. SORGH_AS_0428]